MLLLFIGVEYLRLCFAFSVSYVFRGDCFVDDFRILLSSGSHFLDDAAKKIVGLAAPFEPLPEEISFDTDILEIVRTWRFHEGIYLKSID